MISPKYKKIYSEGAFIFDDIEIDTDLPIVKEILKNAVTDNSLQSARSRNKYVKITFIRGINNNLINLINKELNNCYIKNEEGYAIQTFSDTIFVYSPSDRGLFYGAIEICKMIEQSNKIEEMLIYEYPILPQRGLKVYLPGEDDLDYFKKVVDMLCYYKFNTIMIEIGGAMEYKSHPEINANWIEYCKEMSEYSGKTIAIQESFTWHKDSMHVENGGGRYLSQEIVKDLVDYCKERLMDVIPEVPSLSHCDYILLGNKDISEREYDPYPDTYCPSNPRSYKILFEIMDEVIEVFKPQRMNIGHDEFYTVGICPKCKTRSPESIYADDIQKIYEFLKRKNIETYIWGEKLLDARLENGKPWGGAFIPERVNNEIVYESVPATYKAIDLIPQDVKILHWYWSIDERLEDDFLQRNMDITFGNFAGSRFINWKKRIENGNIKGGIISNWSTLKEENLQRNGILFEIVYASIMFWDVDFDDNLKEQTRDMVFEELFRYRKKGVGQIKNGELIKVVHTTDKYIPFVYFVDGIFIQNDTYHIGDYELEYEDNVNVLIPIIYGKSISNCNVNFEKDSGLITEISYSTLPKKINGKVFFETFYINPRTSKKIKNIKLCNKLGDCEIYLNSIEII